MSGTKPDQKMFEDPVEFRVMTEIGVIEQLARNRVERVLPQGMSMAQFMVLNHFARLGGQQSLVQLARVFQLTKGAMTNTASRLLEQNFVAIVADPNDGRGKLVSLTAEGFAARNQALKMLAEQIQEMRGDIASEEFAAALPFLEKLRGWFDGHRY